MVEHSLRMRGARGSIPLISMKKLFKKRKYKHKEIKKKHIKKKKMKGNKKKSNIIESIRARVV